MFSQGILSGYFVLKGFCEKGLMCGTYECRIQSLFTESLRTKYPDNIPSEKIPLHRIPSYRIPQEKIPLAEIPSGKVTIPYAKIPLGTKVRRFFLKKCALKDFIFDQRDFCQRDFF